MNALVILAVILAFLLGAVTGASLLVLYGLGLHVVAQAKLRETATVKRGKPGVGSGVQGLGG